MFARATAMLRNGIATVGRRLMIDRAGNLAMSFALVSVPLLAAIGASVDYVQLMNSQRHLQDAMDAAAVAAAASMVAGKHDEKTVKDYAINFVLAEITPEVSAAELTALKAKLNVAVTTSGTTVKTYGIKVTGGYKTNLSPFATFMGYSSLPIAAVSTTQSQAVSKNAMSMFLVLDRSGSMSFVTDTVNSSLGVGAKCQNYTSSNWWEYPNLKTSKPCYTNKMGALKAAAASLFSELDTLEKKDTSDTIVRVGGVSFHDATQSPQALDWGVTKTSTYVTSLPDYPTGGTDMTGGMKVAYDALTAASETTAHTGKGNTTFSKFIVLMTDGENTGNSINWNPALDTITLTRCTAAKAAGITIYTVAFMAPTNGEILLKACASSTSNAYIAKDMASLVKAFGDIGNKASKAATRIMN